MRRSRATHGARGVYFCTLSVSLVWRALKSDDTRARQSTSARSCDDGLARKRLNHDCGTGSVERARARERERRQSGLLALLPSWRTVLRDRRQVPLKILRRSSHLCKCACRCFSINSVNHMHNTSTAANVRTLMCTANVTLGLF